ncbi:hypothetical protein OG555_04130 [Kribbella sp. NBC_01484]|uniref:hypothetical protein n=1 Tax=Kribbella sp. NBC_01484 TaxID=2903579 RepID=UPI002E305E29|nr:hypothetical protein [Kribbella sp. NBC_01484]
MTDDLKDKFERLVADPPPPSAVPSEAVFAKVRTVRRRRTAGVLTLAAAAVVAIAVAAGNMTDIDSSPPVSHTPSAPTTIVTGPPTTTPTTTPTKTPSGTTTSSQVTGAVHTPKNNTPPPSSPSTSNTPAAPALGVHVSLKPTVKGRLLTMKVTLSGTALVPTAAGGTPLSTATTPFLDLLGGTQYFFGDGGQSGSDAGAVNCLSGTKRTTGHQTYTLQADPVGTHTYAKAGTYNFSYTVRYCSTKGWVPVTKTTTVTVK